MIHLTAQQLSSYMDGELNEVSTELVRRHISVCEECTLKFAALEEQEERLSQALVHEPGDEFFDRFAAEVERQLPQSKESKRGASSPASRAAALREAARHSGASAPFPVDEDVVEADRPAAPARPVAETTSKAASSWPATPKPDAPRVVPSEPAAVVPSSAAHVPASEDDDGDDSDFDDDVVLAELSAGKAGEPGSTRLETLAR